MWRRWRARRAAGLTVCSLRDLVAPVLDEIADAYASDPDLVGRLLWAHSDSVQALDTAVVDPSGSDIRRMIARTEVDASRAALLSVSPAADGLRLGLTRAVCMQMADDLTARAAATYLGETR